MSNCLTFNTRIQTNPDILDSEIDHEVVLLNIDQGKYFGLNPIASEIWKRMQETITIEVLIEQLLSEYDVERACCQKDTMEILNQMLASGLIRTVET